VRRGGKLGTIPLIATMKKDRPVRRGPSYCQECGAPSREGKLYCSDHVEAHDYVREVRTRIESREAELAAVAERGSRAVDLEGFVVREIVGLLTAHGSRSVCRLAREASIDFVVMTHYVRRLKAAGRIFQTCQPRGEGSICLTEAQERAACG
jgi:hypothetical protein